MGFLNFKNGWRWLGLEKDTDYLWKLHGLIRLRTFEPRQKDIYLFTSHGFVSAWWLYFYIKHKDFPLLPKVIHHKYYINTELIFWQLHWIVAANETSRNESSFLRYLLLFWPVRQLRAAVEHNLSLSQNQLIYILLYIDMYKVMHRSS